AVAGRRGPRRRVRLRPDDRPEGRFQPDVVQQEPQLHDSGAGRGLFEEGWQAALGVQRADEAGDRVRDRKSTRLNSSHVAIAYAVAQITPLSLHDALPICRRWTTWSAASSPPTAG